MKTTILTALLLAPMQAAILQDRSYPTVLPYANVDGWNVLIDMDAGPTCYVLAAYGAGTILRMGVDAAGRASLVVANPTWRRMRSGRSYASVIRFDGRDAWKGSGRYADDAGMGALLFRFADPAFVKDFTEAATLTVRVEGTDMAKVRLAGSRKALAAMALCQGDVDAIAKDAEDGEVETPAAPLRTA